MIRKNYDNKYLVTVNRRAVITLLTTSMSYQIVLEETQPVPVVVFFFSGEFRDKVASFRSLTCGPVKIHPVATHCQVQCAEGSPRKAYAELQHFCQNHHHDVDVVSAANSITSSRVFVFTSHEG